MAPSAKPFCRGTNTHGLPCEKRANYPSAADSARRGRNAPNTCCYWHVDQPHDLGVAPANAEDDSDSDTEDEDDEFYDLSGGEFDDEEASAHGTVLRSRPSHRSRSLSVGGVQDGIEARLTISPRSSAVVAPPPAATPTARSRRGSTPSAPGTGTTAHIDINRRQKLANLAAGIRIMEEQYESLLHPHSDIHSPRQNRSRSRSRTTSPAASGPAPVPRPRARSVVRSVEYEDEPVPAPRATATRPRRTSTRSVARSVEYEDEQQAGAKPLRGILKKKY